MTAPILRNELMGLVYKLVFSDMKIDWKKEITKRFCLFDGLVQTKIVRSNCAKIYA